MMKKYGFIGAGNMGGALAVALCKSVSGNDVFVYDIDKSKAESLCKKTSATFAELKDVLQNCDYIFLGVKPQGLASLVEQIKPVLASRESKPTLVSMLAGVTTEKITNLLGLNLPVIRIMPNLPVSVGAGMILLCKNSLVTSEICNTFKTDMKESGVIDEIDEKLIDAASAVSGCGPAFVSLFIEALSDGGVACGLPRDKALLYATQTALGTAKAILDTPIHPAQLKDNVCSPGGTTIEGVRALEDSAFRAAAIGAVKAAYEKTLKIGK